MSNQSLPDIPLPSGWAGNARAAVLHVISLACYATVVARGRAVNRAHAHVHLTANTDPKDHRVMARALLPELVVVVGITRMADHSETPKAVVPLGKERSSGHRPAACAIRWPPPARRGIAQKSPRLRHPSGGRAFNGRTPSRP